MVLIVTMRGKKAKRRLLKPDPIYRSQLVTRFINRVMRGGKKTLAERIVYGTLKNLEPENVKEEKEKKKKALATFEQAVRNVMPDQEVRSRRVGGATYQIPVPLRHDRAQALAIRWILAAAKARKGMPMVRKLTAELKDAYNNTGAAIKKKSDTHRMAEANKAFAHFKW